MEPELQDVRDLRWDTEHIVEALNGLVGDTKADADHLEKTVQKYNEDGPGKKGIHFYAVEYRPDTVILARDATGDFAGVHLSGRISVRAAVPPRAATGPGCWADPLLRRLENLGETAPWGWRGPRPLARLYRRLPAATTSMTANGSSGRPVTS